MNNAHDIQEPMAPPGIPGDAPPPNEESYDSPPAPGLGTRIGRRTVIGILLTVVLVPPIAGFYSYFSGVPLHLLASVNKSKDGEQAGESAASIALVPGEERTLSVPEGACSTLGIRKGGQFVVATVAPPATTQPLVLSGSTALDPTRLARIRARFAPARVVELAKTHDASPTPGVTELRDIRSGDTVSKGDQLGVFYSVDVSTKKNNLLDALIQLELDQKILDRVEANRDAVPEVFYLTQVRAVEGDRNAINNALSTLRLWDIPQEEIDALHARAKEIAANKDEWSKTPEGIWVKGDKPTAQAAPHGEEDWGGRVTLRSPLDGVIVERNVHVDEMVVDNTVNLFQIADVSQLLVLASCPEDALPTLEALTSSERHWTVRTVGVESSEGLPGTISEIGYIIDPNQHTAVIKGYVENPGKHLRGGQFVSATVNIPPPHGVVEVPIDALVDDGRQSLVFVQPDPAVAKFTLRRVKVTHRFDHSVFVRSTPIPAEEQLTPAEAEAGLLRKQPLLPGERVLLSGAVELTAALSDLEEAHAHLASLKK